ncbi:hypothetical protein F5B19DRAFT_111529 [Rostrohypoxylon terebratum]|nr:hypothetical protein F5B19DRAFT_111529 [Rostrohypoxylon terebratum]
MESAALPRVVASASYPLMTPLQTKLVAQIDEGLSYKEMMPTIREMAEAIGGGGVIPVAKIASSFRDEGQRMSSLLHSIPRPLLRSIVTRTVSRDWGTAVKPEMLYSRDGPGAYLGTLSVAGRGGLTWSADECENLVSMIRRYADAVDVMWEARDAYGGSQLTQDQRDAIDFAARIDSARDPPAESDVDSGGGTDTEMETQIWQAPRELRFSSSGANKSQMARLLADMLDRRQAGVVGDDRKVFPPQSVCMVGNAGDIERRLHDHKLKNSLRGSANAWGLMVHCLSFMGLEPREVLIPVLKAWEPEHINLAEVLLTVLAGSMVTDGGLNVKQPGTRGFTSMGDAESNRSRSEVKAQHPWYRDNYGLSYPEIDRALVALREPIGDTSDRFVDEMNKMDREIRSLRKTIEEAAEDAAEAHKTTERLEKEAETLERILKVLNPDPDPNPKLE